MLEHNNANTQSTVTQTVRVPAGLWNRSKVVLARSRMVTGKRLTMQELIAEGLELRVGQLEKKLEKREGAA